MDGDVPGRSPRGRGPAGLAQAALERFPAKIDPLINTTEAQHHGLAQALDDLGAKAVDWRTSCAVQERDPLTGAATELLGRISEHLDLEERKVLALIDSYLTELVTL